MLHMLRASQAVRPFEADTRISPGRAVLAPALCPVSLMAADAIGRKTARKAGL